MKLKTFALCSALLASNHTLAEIAVPKNVIMEQALPVRQQIENRTPTLSDKQRIIDTTAALVEGLPAKLPIVDQLQVPVFVEVAVENGFRAVERQWIILANPQHQATLDQIGAQILSSKQYDGLGLTLIKFIVPSDYDSKVKLKSLLSLSDDALLDRNHIYQAQRGVQQPAPTTSRKPICDEPIKVGMIDSAVDVEHPGLSANNINTRSFLPADLASPTLHGTAVAGVMIGNDAQLTPLLTRASLFSAVVFYRQSDFDQGATLAAIVEALDWLVANQVTVINMSFTGPDNAILAAAINATTTKQVTLVAAAGNNGPAAKPLYPAAYQDVIAVSAVDKKDVIYRWSNRGDYIDFAAKGVHVLTLKSGGGLGRESGTSMAAPYVSAVAACLAAMPNATPERIFNQLKKQARDLGEPGKDPVFGYGVLD